MGKSITNRQIFLILLLIVSSFRITDIPQLAAKSAGCSGWIMILLMAIPFSLVAVVISKLNGMYPGLTVFEYGQKIIGKTFMYIFSILYIVYFFTLAVYLHHRMTILISTNFLPKTPSAFTLATAVALFGFVVNKGTNTIARLFEILGTVYLVVTLALYFLMITQLEISSILPLASPNEIKEFPKSVMLYVVAYGGLENLLLIPFGEKNQKAPKVVLFSISAIGILFILNIQSSIGMLGVNNAATYSDAFIEAIKLTEPPVIERPDIFYLTFGLAGLFAGLIILIHSIVEFIVRMFPMSKRSVVVSAVCAAVYAATLLVLGMPEAGDTYKTLLPFFVLFFAALFPVFLLAVEKWKQRKLSRQKRRSA